MIMSAGLFLCLLAGVDAHDGIDEPPSLASRSTVRAINSVDEWGASDHCRLLIKIADGVSPAIDS